MAGWGVFRHRAFFVCVALCILLAASLQLLEYLPALPWASANGSPAPVWALCHRHLHDLDWNVKKLETGEEELTTSSGINVGWSWAGLGLLGGCEFQKLGRNDVLGLLRGKRVLVAGDSQARLFLLALLELQIPDMDAIRPDLFKRHSGYRFVWKAEAVVFDFVWAPYTSNITEALETASKEDQPPDLIVLGAGLWHMLHITNNTEYEQDLLQLREIIGATQYSARSIRHDSGDIVDVPHVFWLNTASLIPHLLNTEDKRARMTEDMCLMYNEAVERSKLLYPQGPAMLIDLRHLTSGCGEACTQDGMHYDDAVYQAAVQITLNALRMSTTWPEKVPSSPRRLRKKNDSDPEKKHDSDPGMGHLVSRSWAKYFVKAGGSSSPFHSRGSRTGGSCIRNSFFFPASRRRQPQDLPQLPPPHSELRLCRASDPTEKLVACAGLTLAGE